MTYNIATFIKNILQYQMEISTTQEQFHLHKSNSSAKRVNLGGGGHGIPLQYSCLENPMERGAWQAIVHRVTKYWT